MSTTCLRYTTTTIGPARTPRELRGASLRRALSTFGCHCHAVRDVLCWCSVWSAPRSRPRSGSPLAFFFIIRFIFTFGSVCHPSCPRTQRSGGIRSQRNKPAGHTTIQHNWSALITEVRVKEKPKKMKLWPCSTDSLLLAAYEPRVHKQGSGICRVGRNVYGLCAREEEEGFSTLALSNHAV